MSSHQVIPKLMVEFCYLRPYFGTETVSSVSSVDITDVKDGMDLNSLLSFKAMPAKLSKKILWIVPYDEI